MANIDETKSLFTKETSVSYSYKPTDHRHICQVFVRAKKPRVSNIEWEACYTIDEELFLKTPFEQLIQELKKLPHLTITDHVCHKVSSATLAIQAGFEMDILLQVEFAFSNDLPKVTIIKSHGSFSHDTVVTDA